MYCVVLFWAHFYCCCCATKIMEKYKKHTQPWLFFSSFPLLLREGVSEASHSILLSFPLLIFFFFLIFPTHKQNSEHISLKMKILKSPLRWWRRKWYPSSIKNIFLDLKIFFMYVCLRDSRMMIYGQRSNRKFACGNLFLAWKIISHLLEDFEVLIKSGKLFYIFGKNLILFVQFSLLFFFLMKKFIIYFHMTRRKLIRNHFF